MRPAGAFAFAGQALAAAPQDYDLAPASRSFMLLPANTGFARQVTVQALVAAPQLKRSVVLRMELKKLIIYDGACGFCNRSVMFILKHDKREVFVFSANGSDYAKRELEKLGEFHETTDTLIFIENHRVFIRSDAALEITKYLNLPWKILYLFRYTPRSIRDKVYSFIARNRNRMLGKKDSCIVPDRNIIGRFIED